MKLLIGLGLLGVMVAGVWWSMSQSVTNPVYMPFTNNPVDTAMVAAKWPEVLPVSHASFVLRWGDHVLYNDPVGAIQDYVVHGNPTAVIITHAHGDHLDIPLLEAIMEPTMPLIITSDVYEKLPERLKTPAVVVLANGEVTELADLTITAVPAYNVTEGKTNFHPKGVGNGYVLERAGVRVYNASDTEDTPEFRAQLDIDIAFVPMNEPFTMSVEQAAAGVIAMQPKQVYPYHFRGRDGMSDVATFRSLVEAANLGILVQEADWYGNTTEEEE